MSDIVRIDFTHRDGTITSFKLDGMPKHDVYRQMREGVYFRRVKNDDKSSIQKPEFWHEYEIRWTDKKEE